MPVSAAEKKRFRTIGHNLKPVVSFGSKGLNEGSLQELERALEDHELIKVKIAAEGREGKAAVLKAITDKSQAELIQAVGSIGLFYRAAKKPKANLSNILRNN